RVPVSYCAARRRAARREGEKVQLSPRTIADVFSALHRAGYRVDVLLEPETVRGPDTGPAVPTAVLSLSRTACVRPARPIPAGPRTRPVAGAPPRPRGSRLRRAGSP